MKHNLLLYAYFLYNWFMLHWSYGINNHLITIMRFHDDVIKWKKNPRNWPFVRGIHRSPMNSPHKGRWRGALRFPLIYNWINGWVNNRDAGDLRRHRAHYDVMWFMLWYCLPSESSALKVNQNREAAPSDSRMTKAKYRIHMTAWSQALEMNLHIFIYEFTNIHSRVRT